MIWCNRFIRYQLRELSSSHLDAFRCGLQKPLRSSMYKLRCRLAGYPTPLERADNYKRFQTILKSAGERRVYLFFFPLCLLFIVYSALSFVVDLSSKAALFYSLSTLFGGSLVALLQFHLSWRLNPSLSCLRYPSNTISIVTYLPTYLPVPFPSTTSCTSSSALIYPQVLSCFHQAFSFPSLSFDCYFAY